MSILKQNWCHWIMMMLAQQNCDFGGFLQNRKRLGINYHIVRLQQIDQFSHVRPAKFWTQILFENYVLSSYSCWRWSPPINCIANFIPSKIWIPVADDNLSKSAVKPEPCQKLYEQCDGQRWSGSKCCEAGLSCTFISEWYSQCQEGTFVRQSVQRCMYAYLQIHTLSIPKYLQCDAYLPVAARFELHSAAVISPACAFTSFLLCTA